MANSSLCDCAVVISTCDNYSDIWEPFFKLFHKFWPDNPYPVYLNSETFDCHNDCVGATTLKARTADLSWTRRLKEALERVSAEYIIFMLDDFFIYDYVDTMRIEECIAYMREDANIGSITFCSVDNQTECCNLSGLEKFKHTGISKINLILALWKKSVFLSYLDYDETPWEFEANSLERSIKRSDTFYAFSRNARKAIPYDFSKYGLFAGKWLKPTAGLFKEHGIAHDFSARGFYEEFEFGLIPYVALKIKMDSYLVPCYSMARDNPCVYVDKVIDDGHFSQKFDVTGAQYGAIWYPSSFYGYALEEFKCTIMFKSGAVKILEAGDVLGNFSLYRGVMYFLRPGATVYILAYLEDEISCITVEGYLNKHMNRDDSAAAYDLESKLVPTDYSELLCWNKVHVESLLVAEHFKAFRIYSKLCSKCNDGHGVREYLDGKDRFPGHFSQSYKINKSTEQCVQWDIGGSCGYFSLKNLRVEMLYYGNWFRKLKSHKIRSRNMKGSGVLIDGYWVFSTPSANFTFSLPKKHPDEVRISGDIVAPIPKKVLRKLIRKMKIYRSLIRILAQRHRHVLYELHKKPLGGSCPSGEYVEYNCNLAISLLESPHNIAKFSFCVLISVLHVSTLDRINSVCG